MNYHFDWDPKKAASNRRKHRVTFVEAATVFTDPRAISIYDEEHSAEEDRWITLGISANAGLLVVNHTFEEVDQSDVRIRLISSRMATKREIAQYAE